VDKEVYRVRMLESLGRNLQLSLRNGDKGEKNAKCEARRRPQTQSCSRPDNTATAKDDNEGGGGWLETE
jgi:hypothetical protein